MSKTGLRPWPWNERTEELMLQRLGDHISACLKRADQCKEAAAQESDERVKSQLLDMERQWRHVAQSYEFIESLERFLLDQQKHTLKVPEDNSNKNPPPNNATENTPQINLDA
jgi:hypothetical protein